MPWPTPGATLLGRFYSERNREYPLDRPVTSLGRARENTIVIRDDRIAAHHICLRREGASYVVEALSTEAATYVNGEALTVGCVRRLEHADVVRLAALDFEFEEAKHSGPDRPRLWVTGGVHRGKIFRLPGDRACVGRAPENDIQFPDRSVSRRHCAIVRRGDAWWIEDLGSMNATVVRWNRVVEPTPLWHGDEVALGFSCFVFHERGALRETAHVEEWVEQG